MRWAYVLMGVVLLGGYAAVFGMRLRRTRRIEQMEREQRQAQPAAEGDGPQISPEITRDMIQNKEKTDDSP